jgi:2-hydroxychromene-2-carboxylate isomerase
MTTTPDLEFFYDCSSPWTYFAFTRMAPLAESLAVPVRWRPILVGGVFNAVNQQVYQQRESMFSDPANRRKFEYYLKDLGDWANFCGVKAIMPAGHPISSVKAMRGAFYAEEHNLLLPYSRAVFETYWGGDNADISDEAVLGRLCQAVGLDRDGFLEAIHAQRYKDLLRANTEELIDRGGFGSPTLFINGDDMYFGNDRLALVEARLRQLIRD